jgi:hypothetical protein
MPKFPGTSRRKRRDPLMAPVGATGVLVGTDEGDVLKGRSALSPGRCPWP